MNGRHDDDYVAEQAALYALGALDEEEARLFTRHLGGCAVCAAAVESFAAVVLDLGHSVTPAPAGAGLKSKVLDQVAAADAFRDAATLDANGLRFVRTADLTWRAADLPGVSLKLLATDSEARRATQLVRMDPGAAYPSHRHGGVEEIYLLQGDLLVSGVLMRAGDYCRAEPQTVHSGIRSPNGCVFIATASRENERLSEPD